MHWHCTSSRSTLYPLIRQAFVVSLFFCLSCSGSELVQSPPTPDGGAPIDGGAIDAGGAAPRDGGTPLPAIAPTTAVSIVVEPSDNGAALLAAVKGAKKSVHVTMYMLSNSLLIQALIVQLKAGVDVKVVLNQNFPSGQPNTNVNAYNQLQGGGVPVVYASPSYTFTHEKCVVIDGTQAWIMTMNVTQSSASSNREYLAIDTEAADVADAEQIFQADFALKAVVIGNSKLLITPPSSTAVDARSRLRALIDGARQTLDLEGETLSDTVIVDALVAAKAAGVTVRIVVDGNDTPSSAQKTAVAELKQGLVPIVATSAPSIHAKAIVADGTRAYVGSMNFTTGSLLNNREVGIITDAPAEVAKVRAAIAQDFAAGAPL